MTDSTEIGRYCDELLAASTVADYCPNGLQLAGARPVRRLVSGVTASLALIEAALAADADAILVHHGWFWKGEDPRLVGMHGRRVRAAVRGGLALLAYHLPLDVHPELGNNRQLAAVLDLRDAAAASADGLVWTGTLAAPQPGAAVAALVAERLGRSPLHVPVLERPVQRIAWCTGAAQRFIDQAAALGADLYLSGEVSEPTVHQARELGLDYIAAGHHATERYGVQALGEHLAGHFGLGHGFIDIDNPA
ncbi:Nif3-like dinuclear metal center hexameric protein [Thiohalocapsa halophila]|uniref:Nif3-like dinuclear metal center hexameric protein n=1 Tax=Thiohalocapsa halophila TaxID=69359 RepID=A0ABS1CC14_9GAMM|nr:Nif3-like dinuclear metal center hexameric protein [Thiohalocapsa halophila]MBK1629452.1 Nif3-like dinuclear metal center hexameric protein [Thiohalocapsa halophila]